MNENDSYIYGLLITDGNLSLLERNRGKVSLEVNSKDRDIIEKLFKIIPNSSISERTRDTNFKENYKTCSFTNTRLDFRKQLIEWGFPTENKTLEANIPKVKFSELDFWRGAIDGDGSIGFIKEGNPFISLVTKSEFLKNSFCKFLKEKYGIVKNINRNARDNVFNITIKNEEALLIAKDLYLSNNCQLYLNRKYNAAKEIQQWIRTTKKVNRRSWTKEEDEYILNHTIEESVEHLGRTISSIKNRLFRIK